MKNELEYFLSSDRVMTVESINKVAAVVNVYQDSAK